MALVAVAMLIYAALWLMDPDPKGLQERMSVLDRFFFREI